MITIVLSLLEFPVYRDQKKRENSQIKAAEAKVSWILIPCMGQGPKNMDSYISHNATHPSWETPTSFKLHTLVMQAFY